VALPEESLQALQALGFSELEAAIYTLLVQEAPLTGYRIAHGLNKPVANTYKGITALQARGAVIVDDGESRLCRVVPPQELFGQLEQRLRQRCGRAAEALARLTPAPGDERVYRLQTWEQAIERAHQMIRRAGQVVIAAAFPGPLIEIRNELEAAAARGVGVILKVYRPVEVRGADIVLSNEADFLLTHLPGEELSLVVDAEEHLGWTLAIGASSRGSGAAVSSSP
jgi:sugar-specific transcriptional regulator TrmB